tara:strand:+ start:346 stop:489 length:144 start_codon:yes stop_codon:yes gene_type:complete
LCFGKFLFGSETERGTSSEFRPFSCACRMHEFGGDGGTRDALDERRR